MPIYNVIIMSKTVGEIFIEADTPEEAERFVQNDLIHSPKEVQVDSSTIAEATQEIDLIGRYITRTDNTYYRYPNDTP